MHPLSLSIHCAFPNLVDRHHQTEPNLPTHHCTDLARRAGIQADFYITVIRRGTGSNRARTCSTFESRSSKLMASEPPLSAGASARRLLPFPVCMRRNGHNGSLSCNSRHVSFRRLGLLRPHGASFRLGMGCEASHGVSYIVYACRRACFSDIRKTGPAESPN